MYEIKYNLENETLLEESTLPVGNYYDKYNNSNRVARIVIHRFINNFTELAKLTKAKTILEIRAGSGEVSNKLINELKPNIYISSEISSKWIKDKKCKTKSDLWISASSFNLPFKDKSVDLVVAPEILVHLANPKILLQEAHRVARKYILASVPQEPIWRLLRIVNGAYLLELNGSPCFVQHWSKRKFINLMSSVGKIIAVRTPLPWTLVLIRLY